MRIESLETIKGLVGSELGISDWVMIDQARIDAFADATEDHNSIHVDPEAGRAWGLGGTIAHGFLTLSMILRLQEGIVPIPERLARGFNYGLEKVRFLAPVPSGRRIRGRFDLRAFTETKPGNWRSEVGVTIEIEGEDKPALSATWMSLAILD
jgi:acyl dehydratase